MYGIQGHRHSATLRRHRSGSWVNSSLFTQSWRSSQELQDCFHLSRATLALSFIPFLVFQQWSGPILYLKVSRFKGIMFMKGLNCLQINRRNSWWLFFLFLFCLFPWQIGPITLLSVFSTVCIFWLCCKYLQCLKSSM